MVEFSQEFTEATDDDRRAAHSEGDIANRFSIKHPHTRFCHDWGRWIEWTGTHWQIDRTTQVYDMIHAICAKLSATANSGGKQLGSSRTVAGAERIAKSDRRHAITSETLDTDPWLLNTPTGTVDLRAGDTRPNRPEDFITKITAVGPGGECPLWHKFLGEITDGDVELAAFLQRTVGYAMTGSTRDHALFFLHGEGANGKSVFINTIANILGDYHRSAPTATFMESRFPRHLTELARLQGARFVTTSETSVGQRWDDSRIKHLTGGDPITAQFMRQDHFEFTPVFKLFIAGNYKPSLNAVDEAMRRRLHMIPFNVVIPVADRDVELPDKLANEWPDILQWAVDGAAAWYAGGLQAPDTVTGATDEYFEDEDQITSWIKDRCTEDPKAKVRFTELYTCFVEWARSAGVEPPILAGNKFSTELRRRGYRRSRSENARFFHGLRI